MSIATRLLGRLPRRTHARSAFTLIDTLMTVIILSILAALVIPQFTNASGPARRASLASQLRTVRNQINLYNFDNPATPFNPLVPGGPNAWDQLVNNDYLTDPPVNPIQFDSSAVGAFPAMGMGWVWSDPLGSGMTIYAVGSNGLYFDDDGDGTPD